MRREVIMIENLVSPFVLIGSLAVLSALSTFVLFWMLDARNRKLRRARMAKCGGQSSEE